MRLTSEDAQRVEVIAPMRAAGCQHAHLVIVAPFDARTCQQKVADADVRGGIEFGRSKRLEPMPMADVPGIT